MANEANPAYLPVKDIITTNYDSNYVVTSLSNLTTHDDVTDHEPSIAWLVMVPLVVGIIIVVTIVGNVFVMVAFCRDKRIHGRVASLLILNLAVSDFIIGLVVLSVNLAWITWNEVLGGESWLLGEIFCKIWLIVDNTATMLSVFTIILISLDRYWLLTKKLQYQNFQTRKRVLITLAFLWVSTAVIYTILAVGWPYFTGEHNVDFSKECELDMAYNVYATTVQLICEFIIPLGIIIILNTTVYIKIRARAKGLKKVGRPKLSNRIEPKSIVMETSRRSSPIALANVHLAFQPAPQAANETDRVTESSFVNNVGDYQTIQRNGCCRASARNNTSADVAHKSRKEFARHLRAAIVLAVLVTVFVACWLPYQIANIVNAICEECVSSLTWEIVNNILWCNSFINPFLYAATNVHFRRNFIEILGLRRFRYFDEKARAAHRPSSTADQVRN